MNVKRLVLVVLACTALAFLAGGCKKDPDPTTAAEMKEKLAGKVKLLLWKVDASGEQKTKVDALLDGLAPDLLAFQNENKTLQRALFVVLAADPLDEAALLGLQTKGLDLFDRYTKRMAKASVDLSAILTVKQRRELVRLWKEWELGN